MSKRTESEANEVFDLEEVSWKELFNILLKRRVIVVGIIVFTVVLSLIYSFFVAVPIYKAQVECQVKGLNTGVHAFEIENQPLAVTNELLKQARKLEFMDQVSMRLANKGIQITGSNLASILVFEKGSVEGRILITASYESKKDVMHIANVAAEVLSQYSSDYLIKRLQQQLAYYDEQVKLEKANIDEALSEYEKYLSSTDSGFKLQSDININESILAQLKANLISGNLGAGKSRAQLEQDIIQLEDKIESLRKRLIDEYSSEKLYNEELKGRLKLFNLLVLDYSRLELAEKYLNSKSNVNIISYAVEPEHASWPNVKFITAVALTMGICISLFVALTIEYFKSKKSKCRMWHCNPIMRIR